MKKLAQRTPLVPTVLFVDDDAMQLTLVRLGFRDAPLRLLTAERPQEALELLQAEPVDIIVSDLDMPEMDGISLLKQARALRPDTVRILLTGRATLQATLQAVNQAEVFRVLTKPAALPELREVIELSCERAQQARAAAASERAEARRRETLAQLGREHPGIDVVPQGPYPLGEERCAPLCQRLAAGPLAALLPDSLG